MASLAFRGLLLFRGKFRSDRLEKNLLLDPRNLLLYNLSTKFVMRFPFSLTYFS